MTSDQLYQLALGFMGIITALSGAYVLKIKADASRITLDAQSDKERDDTDNYVTKAITDEVVKRGNRVADCERELREYIGKHASEKGRADQLYKDLQDALGKNEIQAKFLRESAGEIKALNDLNAFQEAKIHELEAKAASQLNDGYGEK